MYVPITNTNAMQGHIHALEASREPLQVQPQQMLINECKETNTTSGR